jgi:aerobic carbon-monoxide dehydrogenase medium subunit
MSAEFVVASSLDEAMAALADEDAVALAGGVAVGLLANLGLFSGARLVSLARVPELRGVRADDGSLVLGAAMTHAQLAADPVVRQRFPALSTMFGHIGNVRVRAWGTVGGNLALAEPSQDPPVLLSTLDAELLVHGPDGARRLPVAELSDGPMSTVLSQGELITNVVVPGLAADETCVYRKFLPRTADDYATVSVAVKLRADGDHVAAARLFCGSVGPVPVACDTATGMLLGRSITEHDRLDDVVEAVRDAVSPVTDHRGSADYKREMAGVFARRAILDSFATLARRDQRGGRA